MKTPHTRITTDISTCTHAELSELLPECFRDAGKIVQFEGREALKKPPSITAEEDGTVQIMIEHLWRRDGWDESDYKKHERTRAKLHSRPARRNHTHGIGAWSRHPRY